MATKLNKVLVNVDQSDKDNGGFSDEEKAVARANIGAISKDKFQQQFKVIGHNQINLKLIILKISQ